MNKYTLTYYPYGERAIEISWPQRIALDVLREMKAVSEAIREHYGATIEDLVPTYAKLLILFSEPVHFGAELEQLKGIIESIELKDSWSVTRWKIPVCYDVCYGLDLEEICQKKQLSLEEFIEIHSGKDYPIHFFGFLPGFFYLGGLDEKLHFSRKESPRRRVTKGSVGIGGSQTGIYPQNSPGGWQLIGRTPIDLFDAKADPPVFAKLGDVIRFIPVDQMEFDRIKTLAPNFMLEKEVIE